LESGIYDVPEGTGRIRSIEINVVGNYITVGGGNSNDIIIIIIIIDYSDVLKSRAYRLSNILALGK
jgi:hypothetical protein